MSAGSWALIGPLTGAVPTHWPLVPVVEDRIRRFVREIGSDQDPVQLIKVHRAHFVAETGQSPCWVWLDAAGAVQGHLLAWVDPNAKKRKSLFVGQVWSDAAVPEDLRKALVQSMEEHARALGCWAMEGWCENPAMLRLYRRIGLATPFMTAVRHILEPV